jgi:uncharacterized protein YecT (DUF1311 family)
MNSLRFSVRAVGASLLLSIVAYVPTTAQERNLTRCLSIADVNERIDCLESRGTVPNQGIAPAPTIRPSKQTRVSPSFDCQAVTNSIERAICADPDLSEWDLRMGQQYQLALRARKDIDSQSIAENQRAWLSQRNSRCVAVADTAVWACLLEMTKQRATALAQLATSAPITSTPVPATTVTPVVPQALNGSTPEPTARPIANSTNVTPPSSGDDGLSKAFLFVLFVIGLVFSLKIANAARRKRLLIAKYGDAIAARILARQIWQGMTEEQLIESWGRPVEIGSEVMRTKTKQIWKYGQTGKNRFRERVTVENGTVSGWKN